MDSHKKLIIINYYSISNRLDIKLNAGISGSKNLLLLQTIFIIKSSYLFHLFYLIYQLRETQNNMRNVHGTFKMRS